MDKDTYKVWASTSYKCDDGGPYEMGPVYWGYNL